MNMKRFIIERDIPGAGHMTPEDIQIVVRSSISAIAVLGKPYRWIESYLSDDKVYCIHEAESEDVIREHSTCASLVVTKIVEVKNRIQPESAEDF
jgi:hypothetical protein